MLRAIVNLPTPGKLFRRRMKGGGDFDILRPRKGFAICIEKKCVSFYVLWCYFRVICDGCVGAGLSGIVGRITLVLWLFVGNVDKPLTVKLTCA